MLLDDRLRASAGRTGRLAVRVSVKSVNHRFLDLKLRMPEDLICTSCGCGRSCAKKFIAGMWK